MKACSACGKEKPEGDFPRDRSRKSGLYSRCRDCLAEAKKKARACIPRDELRRLERRLRLKARYGITPEEYDELLASQDGVCAVCKRNGHTAQSLHVDHDHRTGRVRGLLCAKCNLALGLLDESVETLRRIEEYLACAIP